MSQSGIFNVLDYGLTTTDETGVDNQMYLQQLVTNLLSTDPSFTGGYGGTILFPSVGPFRIAGTITVGGSTTSPPNTPISLIFQGSGHQDAESPNLIQMSSGVDLFVIDTNADNAGDDIGGTVFQDLTMIYNEPSPPAASGAAIHVVGAAQNVKLLRVVVIDFSQGVWFDNSLSCSMIDCEIYNAATYGTALTIGGADGLYSSIESYIAGCTFISFQNPQGIAVQVYGCEHLRMVNTRLEGYQQGIVITTASANGNIRKLYFGNVSCFPSSEESGTGAAVSITTSSTSNAAVCQIFFDSCEFGGYGSSYTGGGVYIAAPGNVNAPIDQIRFLDCHCCLWAGPGINIAGGENIEILGGYFSCNGRTAVGQLQSGILISGAAQAVRVTGAACNNSVYNPDASPPAYAPATQHVGIYIEGSGASNVLISHCGLAGNSANAIVIGAGGLSVSAVFIRGCNANGYGTSPNAAIDIIGEVANIQISDCAGYNDKGPSLSTSMPSGTFSNTTFGYYGPVAFYVKGAGDVTIDGVNTLLKDGGYTLSPGETAAIAGTATAFLAVGR